MMGSLLMLAGCHSVMPDAGQEAVLIMKPMFYGHGGVDPEPVKTGRSYVAWTTDEVYINTQPVVYESSFDDMMSKDGVPLDFHSVIRVQVTDSVSLVKNFGVKWYENNLAAPYANAVRQAVKKHGMNETAIESQAVEEIDSEVKSVLESYIKETNLPIRLLDMTVGRANPPDSVKSQRVETAAQQQRVQTEQQRKLAEDSRLLSEKARAAADLAYREDMKLDPEQFLQLEKIKMQREVCTKGNCTFFVDGQVQPVKNVN